MPLSLSNGKKVQYKLSLPAKHRPGSPINLLMT